MTDYIKKPDGFLSHEPHLEDNYEWDEEVTMKINIFHEKVLNFVENKGITAMLSGDRVLIPEERVLYIYE